MMSLTDEELLTDSADPGGTFADFYERHERVLLAYFRRRAPSAEVAADLTAETFARALAGRRRYRPQGPGSALAWVFGIAQNVLAASVRRGAIEDRARRKLGLPPMALIDAQIDAIDRLVAEDEVGRALATLPADQREAVRARILDERDYHDIAHALSCSESVVRQRVSRGLKRLRRELEGSYGNS